MSATRLMVLGCVLGHGSAHGYLVMNDLLSWGAHEWGNVKPGSIYHALRQLAKQGMLTATDNAEVPGRVDYRITEQGRDEFFQLLRQAIVEVSTRPDLFYAGVGFMIELSRPEAIELLTERGRRLAQWRDELAPYVAADTASTSHISELVGLWMHTATTSLEWTHGLIDRLEHGHYIFADEPGGRYAAARGEPPPDATTSS